MNIYSGTENHIGNNENIPINNEPHSKNNKYEKLESLFLNIIYI